MADRVTQGPLIGRPYGGVFITYWLKTSYAQSLNACFVRIDLLLLESAVKCDYY